MVIIVREAGRIRGVKMSCSPQTIPLNVLYNLNFPKSGDALFYMYTYVPPC